MKTLTIEIRPAAIEDASALCAIYDAAMRSSHTGLMPAAALEHMLGRRGLQWWENLLMTKPGAPLALRFDGKIAGYVSVGKSRIERTGCDGEIFEMCLLPEYQGLGYGKPLMEAGRRRLASAGFKRAAVWMVSSNECAVRLCKTTGSQPVAKGQENIQGALIPLIAYGFDVQKALV